ncbi:unnamed protein product [Periconia digitata]|uniref:Uncharacterized protein n=1 Tax=Periconia digitata TaxID=1303443 RepID=A0A9W4U2T9_9PLEO|nr:unnamed protein product [Periconia digitata]
MKFSIAAALALASFQAVAALPSPPLTDAIVPAIEDDSSVNSTDVEERGLFTKYPCTRGASIKLFKSHLCKGSATRTDILNFPLPEGYVDRCQDVTSKSDMTGIKLLSPLDMYPSMAQWIVWQEPGCKGRSKVLRPNGLCEHIMSEKGQVETPPIKSFKLIAKDATKCEANREDGRS